MNKFAFIAGLLLTHSACTWQNTLAHVANYPAQARFVTSNDLHNAPRWIANANTRFLIKSDTEQGVHAGTDLISSAQRGLDQITGHATGPVINLAVDWPRQPYNHELRSRSIYGVHLPRLGNAKKSLPVHVLSKQGEHLHTLQLNISPSLLGEPWHATGQVEQSFATLATTLLGG